MEIEIETANRMRLSDFADKHGLKMKLMERTRTDLHPSINFETNRWCAHFANVEVKDGSMLVGTSGNGTTARLAMKDYAKQISGKCLVIDAFKPARREVYAPELF